ncbi:MAG: DUF1036 domain-containing protein [Alphaproteobacteria bacterium]|nr:DUF1036 domain-containing protein [Alphaproteobacteria bacterium]
MTGRTDLLLARLATASPALAALKVCNKTQHNLHLALDRCPAQGWMRRGWLSAAGSHATLIPKALQSRYYYPYANDGGPGSFRGNHDFCVTPSTAFRIRGRRPLAPSASTGGDSSK